MNSKIVLISIFIIFFALVNNIEAQHHHEGVNQRGNHVMGFDHAKTTHHFYLTQNGGTIQVQANDPKDRVSQNQIREHLKIVSERFTDGDFSMPMMIHAQTPPGIPIMKKLKAEIKYSFEEIEKGGLVRIATDNPKALRAIHNFLKFQIKDHQTGDSGQIEKP
jgi:hypothetical protein